MRKVFNGLFVYDLMSDRSAFWKALVFTIMVFAVGLLLGAYLETNRADNLNRILQNSEIDLLDEQLRSRTITDFNLSCGLSVNNTFEFADRIYNEAMKLEDDDSATKFTDDLKIIHKRYDLLRTLLWVQSIELKKQCSNNFHSVVYLYQYESDDVNTRALQISLSRLMLELKNNHPGEILLIPIAGDSNLASVNLVLKEYNISKLPVIIVDEKKVIDKLININELEKLVFQNNKQ